MDNSIDNRLLPAAEEYAGSIQGEKMETSDPTGPRRLKDKNRSSPERRRKRVRTSFQCDIARWRKVEVKGKLEALVLRWKIFGSPAEKLRKIRPRMMNTDKWIAFKQVSTARKLWKKYLLVEAAGKGDAFWKRFRSLSRKLNPGLPRWRQESVPEGSSEAMDNNLGEEARGGLTEEDAIAFDDGAHETGRSISPPESGNDVVDSRMAKDPMISTGDRASVSEYNEEGNKIGDFKWNQSVGGLEFNDTVEASSAWLDKLKAVEPISFASYEVSILGRSDTVAMPLGKHSYDAGFDMKDLSIMTMPSAAVFEYEPGPADPNNFCDTVFSFLY
ncbi:MAG: hypothetical protein Q9186_000428 [Xanthomendoza sp. 1 TL-2023]